MSFPHVIFASFNDAPAVEDTANRGGRAYGQSLWYDDGRKFRFILCGATATISGDLAQGPAVITGDYTDLATDNAHAVGATVITFTATTTTAANIYAEGWMFCNKGGVRAGGRVYTVASNILFAATAGITATLHSDDPIRVALSTLDEVGFLQNTYKSILNVPITTATNRIIGVSPGIVTAAQYGWTQSGGVAAVNSAASQVVGNNLVPVLAAAGRVGVSAGDVLENIGVALSVPTTAGEWGAIYLKLD